MEQELKDYYTVRQVSTMLGVSEKSVRDFINNGELKAIKVGRWRIPQKSLQEFFDTRSAQLVKQTEKEAVKFIKNQEKMNAGEKKGILVLDCYSTEGKTHGQLGQDIMENLAPGKSKILWKYSYNPELKRARHVFWGDLEKLNYILQAMHNRVEGVDI